MAVPILWAAEHLHWLLSHGWAGHIYNLDAEFAYHYETMGAMHQYESEHRGWVDR